MILSPEDCTCPISDAGVSLVNSTICPGTYLFMMVLQGFLRGRCDFSSPCQSVSSREEVDKEYDFIVVGAGAAGPIVAGRLSHDTPFKVLLIEAGPEAPIGSRVPSFYKAFWDNSEVDWRYRTVPADYCLDQGSKGCRWPRGKVLGGSTVLNGMMYHRGHPADYEDWVNAGAKGWSWEEDLQYFYLTENNRQIGSLVSSEHHSDSGPLPIQQFNYQPEAVYQLLDAMEETGFPLIKDMNDPNTPVGFTIAQMFTADGQRYTTARAFLEPESARPNLHVKLNAHVSRVLFEGRRAVGVEFIDGDGKTTVVRASKEVILSAGAIGTPQILQLSGVGPAATLAALGVPLVADLPAGMNLRNHLGVTFDFLLTAVNDTRILNWAVLTDYLLGRDGPMSSTGITQVTGLLYSSLADTDREQPDLQFFFNGFYADCSETGQIGEPGTSDEGVIVTANGVALLPRSVGFVLINSTDPFDPPVMDPQYFTDPDDMTMVMDGARVLKRIFDSKILQDKFNIRLTSKSTSQCDDVGEQWTDEWLECMIRYSTDPQNHQLGTAAMGSVIDPHLRVYNVTGLRVIDASVMPTAVTGNPQGAIMMVAERGAQFILDEYN